MVQARALLLDYVDLRNADVALGLARTYDPTIVGMAGAAGAPLGDIDTAEDWYRTWYELAREAGAISDTVALDRIIRAMRRVDPAR